MILHIGNDFFVRSEDILMILEYSEAKKNEDTKEFLKKCKRATITKEPPKSIVVTQENGIQTMYLSPISSRTLLKRSDIKITDLV
ncbi:MAG: DUF370 domain-containing protein [Christensenellaceae bacterium]